MILSPPVAQHRKLGSARWVRQSAWRAFFMRQMVSLLAVTFRVYCYGYGICPPYGHKLALVTPPDLT